MTTGCAGMSVEDWEVHVGDNIEIDRYHKGIKIKRTWHHSWLGT